ncbi:MAG: DUF4337 domain-containing protein [Hyphomicrobiaceae bacterium]|nr:DUF4337 domain-containing protein [Hyphomicrobiaceae bacterium]
MAIGDLEPPTDARGDRDRWIGVFIGILAVILAICSMGGDNASKEATLKTIAATNTWAFFQAKNMRRQVVRAQIEAVNLALITTPGLDAAAKASLEKTLAAHEQTAKLLTSDPKGGEGLDELFSKGKALDAERDAAMARDPYFDYGQALLQIAIVLASIAIISGGTALLGMSFVVGVLGTLFTLNGYLMLVAIPGIG